MVVGDVPQGVPQRDAICVYRNCENSPNEVESHSTPILMTCRQRRSRRRSTLRNGPTRPWSESNSPSLQPTQRDSDRLMAAPAGAVVTDNDHDLSYSTPEEFDAACPSS